MEGKTIVMVTDETELTEKTERIVKMLDGKILEDVPLGKKLC